MNGIDAEKFLRLSGGLREAFAALGRAPLTQDQRGRWQRRLLAITNAAKRDLPRAQEQLERFRADWNSAVPSVPLGPPPEPPPAATD